MKNLYSCLIILTFFTSCNSDTEALQDGTDNGILHRGINEPLPLITSNPFDNAGRLHDELFESYYESVNLPTSIPDIISRVETIAGTNTTFIEMKETNYYSVSPDRIQYIVEHKNTCVAEIIASSSLTAAAKVSLSEFINSLIVLFPTESSGDALSDFVIKYENAVSANPLFTTNDKKIMLISTSVARHSVCMARKRPKKNTDPDWIIFVGNIIAGTEGSEESSAKAVTMALVSGIVQN